MSNHLHRVGSPVAGSSRLGSSAVAETMARVAALKKTLVAASHASSVNADTVLHPPACTSGSFRASASALQSPGDRVQISSPLRYSHRDNEGSSFMALQAERTKLELKAAHLTEQCDILEAQHHVLRSHGQPTTQSNDTEKSLLQLRDDLKRRLHAAEVARCASEHRLETGSAALARCQAELSQQSSLREKETDPLSPWMAMEVKSLKTIHAAEHTKLSDINAALVRKSEELSQVQYELSEASNGRHLATGSSDKLIKDVDMLTKQLEAGRERRKVVGLDLDEMKAKHTLRDLNLKRDLKEATVHSEAAKAELDESRSELKSWEVRTATARAEDLELQGELDIARAAHAELLSQAAREASERTRETTTLQERLRDVLAEHKDLERQVLDLDVAVKKQTDEGGAWQKEHGAKTSELRSLHASEAEATSQSEKLMKQASQRVRAVLQQIDDEYKQNLELEKEIAIARDVVGDTGHDGRVPHTVVSAKGSSKTQGWMSTARHMHREMDMLKQWKQAALASFNRMHNEMKVVEQQYQQQLQHNQDMQKRIEHMRQQATSAIEQHISHGESSGSSSSPQPLQARPSQPADERMVVA